MSITIHHGDSREVLKTLADASVDSVVCDPPYALVSIGKRLGKPGAAPIQHGKDGACARAARGFMGKTWDTGETAFAVEFWAEVYRVLKPGGHVVAFSGTRTYHRLACAIEDAGFEIRDMLSWLYGSGFPKSHDVAKGIDRVGGASPAAQAELLRRRRADAGLSRGEVAEAVGCTESSVRDWEEGRARAIGAAVEFVVPSPAYRSKLAALLGYTADERVVIGIGGGRRGVYETGHRGIAYGEPVSPLAQQWSGWGTALKPACEPIVFARKPPDGTVASNVLAHGTGAINIDATRIHSDDAQGGEYTVKRLKPGATLDKTGGNWRPENGPEFVGNMKPGRWPANVIHDGSDEVVAAFPSAPGQLAPVGPKNGAKPTVNTYGDYGPREQFNPRGDSGSAARFFYAAEPDDLCGLCGCPSGAFSGKLSPCNANAAEPSSPTENTPSADTAPCDAAVSQPPVREVKNLASSDLATDAEIPSSRHRRVGSDTAAGPAATPGLSSLAQNVMSAGSLCGSCATAIAQSLAATQRGQSPASLPCPASIDGRSWQILTSSLALHVEGRESTDTTTTIPSLKLLLGSVFHAIGDTTRPAKGVAQANTESGPKRFHYSSKADATDRLGSKHPTVKPTDLMRWLVRLVTPPGGVVLDPFAGSGSTGVAAIAEGFDAILIEREDEYVADIHRRIAWAKGEGRLTAQEKAKKPDLGLEGLSLFGDAA